MKRKQHGAWWDNMNHFLYPEFFNTYLHSGGRYENGKCSGRINKKTEQNDEDNGQKGWKKKAKEGCRYSL